MPPQPSARNYEGYAALSRYIGRIDGLHIFRRFGELHTRNLLYLQDELRDLEETLHGCDLQPGIEHGSRRSDQIADRSRLMLLVRARLKEYDDGILAYAAIRKLEKPNKKRQLHTLRAYIETQRPLLQDEEPLLDNDTFPPWITENLKLARFEALQIDTEGLSLKFISPARVRTTVRVIVTVAGSVFLIIPVLLLFFLHRSETAKLVVVVCSLVLFAGVTAGVTSAKNWEVLAASVA
ncbi:hypothetical protein BST61_g9899 [Cercospora zeina]